MCSQVNQTRGQDLVRGLNNAYLRPSIGFTTEGSEKAGISTGWAFGDGNVQSLIGFDLSIVDPTRSAIRFGGRLNLVKGFNLEASGAVAIEGEDEPDRVGFGFGMGLSGNYLGIFGAEVALWNPGNSGREQTVITAFLDPFKAAIFF